MKLYQTLNRNQIKINYRKSDDYIFYNKHKHLLFGLDMYHKLENAKNEFDVIRANIIIYSILNKKELDEAIEYAYVFSKMTTSEAQDYIKEKMTNHPYVLDANGKIFVPIFPRSINTLYDHDYGRLLTYPYNSIIKDYSSSCIDLFEVYNFSLYKSLFTKFVTIFQNEDILVVYHYDFKSLYIINNQGRLDVKIALFDKYLKKIVDNHIVERTKPVIEAYILNDREKFYKALINNNLISKKMIAIIKNKENKFKHKKELKVR